MITAASRAQARGYAAELRARRRDGRLEATRRTLIVPDPGGRRIGSGASTLLALWRVIARLRRIDPSESDPTAVLAGRRVLILHAGGDARRLPAYAALGKLFTPLPMEIAPDRPAALFDLVLQDLDAVSLPANSGILVASGDVYLDVAKHDVAVTSPGITGFAFAGDLDRARRHGVYVLDDDGAVRALLQKPDEDAARADGAIDASGRLLIDTGLLAIDAATAARWLRLAGVHGRGRGMACGPGPLRDVIDARARPLDLYADILNARAAGPPWLEGRLFHATILPECAFLHLGTSRELLDRLLPDARSCNTLAFNSMIDLGGVHHGRAVLIEGCDGHAELALPGPNLLVGVPRSLSRRIELPPGWGLVFLPVDRDDWTAILFGLDDDFKTSRGAGGRFGDGSLADFLSRSGVEAGALWPTEDAAAQSLWNARLWLAGTPDDVLDRTLWMSQVGARPPEDWLRQPRLSMADVMDRADHRRLVRHRTELQRRARIEHVSERLSRDPRLSAQRIVEEIANEQEAVAALGRLQDSVNVQEEPCAAARVHRVADRIMDRFPSAASAWPPPTDAGHTGAAFEAVAGAVATSAPLADAPAADVLQPGNAVDALAPARIDLAGGWSDTPPICNELGGCVVNMAVRIDGVAPVQATVRILPEPVVRLVSVDLGRDETIRAAAPLLDHTNPADWSALPKAALILSGFCPPRPGLDLARWLTTMGGGVEVSLSSRLPKGSGLGTSSVLGATVLSGLAHARGAPVARADLIRQTSRLEQMMGTGGGWQDQVGAIVGGLELLETRPGREQVPAITPIPVEADLESALHERMILYDTGLQRLARDILGNVVLRFLDRDAGILDLIDRLKDGAAKMRRALERGDLAAFGRGLRGYWDLKKRIDPGATNEAIEDLIRPLEPHLAGFALPGAGGGGFLFMLARDVGAAVRVREMLAGGADPAAGLRDVQIDRDGLIVAANSP
ncbi:MAG: fucose pyrophosphorylase domain-containing protein [Planctomycetota bacterium]